MRCVVWGLHRPPVESRPAARQRLDPSPSSFSSLFDDCLLTVRTTVEALMQLSSVAESSLDSQAKVACGVRRQPLRPATWNRAKSPPAACGPGAVLIRGSPRAFSLEIGTTRFTQGLTAMLKATAPTTGHGSSPRGSRSRAVRPARRSPPPTWTGGPPPLFGYWHPGNPIRKRSLGGSPRFYRADLRAHRRHRADLRRDRHRVRRRAPP